MSAFDQTASSPPPATSPDATSTSTGPTIKEQAVNGNVCVQSSLLTLRDVLTRNRNLPPPSTTFYLNKHAGASSAYNSVKNHPVTQDLANGTPVFINFNESWHSLLSGPMATSVKNQAGATSNEFGNLAGARAPPAYTAANDTPLTRKMAQDARREILD
jgi:hypothetical protein